MLNSDLAIRRQSVREALSQSGVERGTMRTTSEQRKKKILVVDLGGVMGGVEYYIETLSGMLLERATLLSLCVPPELAQRLRGKGIKVFLLPPFAG